MNQILKIYFSFCATYITEQELFHRFSNNRIILKKALSIRNFFKLTPLQDIGNNNGYRIMEYKEGEGWVFIKWL